MLKNLIKKLLLITITLVIISVNYKIYASGAYMGEPDEKQKAKNNEIGKRKDKEMYVYKTIRSENKKINILDIEVYYQETDYYCGPAVAQMLIKYVTNRLIPQNTLARDMGTTKEHGTDFSSMIYDINQYRGLIDYYVIRNTNERDFFSSLKKTIDDNHPVVILINYTGDLDDKYPSNGGHYLLGRGYHDFGKNDKMVYFIDPYEKAPTKGKSKKPLETILGAMKHKESGRGFFAY